MKPLVTVGVFFILASASLAGAAESGSGRGDLSNKPWAKYCHVEGIKLNSASDEKYLANLAKSCEALDACLLACIRSGCAERIGGGCSHMCSGPNGELNLMQAAAEYQAGTAYICRRPPNNSFKPNPLRRFVDWGRCWFSFPSRSARCGSA